MKKLKLSELNLGNAEVLSREQLKKVLGGYGSGGSSDPIYCTTIYTDFQGDYHETTGECAGFFPSSCRDIANSTCWTEAEEAGGICVSSECSILQQV